ncbi:hypothetical protein HK101_005908, partial [Irineochytrium annulatum]
ALVTNAQYLILLLVFSLLIGGFNTFVTLISDYVTPAGYTEDDAGNLGIVAIVLGIVSAGILGPLLDRYGAHKIVLKVLPFIAVGGCVLFYFGLGANNLQAPLYAGAVLFGLGGFPIMPLCLELAVEATYPVGEGLSSGLLWTGTQIMGVILLVVSNALREPDGGLRKGVALQVGVFVLCALTALAYTARNRRRDMEGEASAKDVVSVGAGSGEHVEMEGRKEGEILDNLRDVENRIYHFLADNETLF